MLSCLFVNPLFPEERDEAADKGWYRNYFIALAPRLEVGGCFTAHNVLSTWDRGIEEFLVHVRGQPNFTTTINRASRFGISISYKTAKE